MYLLMEWHSHSLCGNMTWQDITLWNTQSRPLPTMCRQGMEETVLWLTLHLGANRVSKKELDIVFCKSPRAQGMPRLRPGTHLEYGAGGLEGKAWRRPSDRLLTPWMGGRIPWAGSRQRAPRRSSPQNSRVLDAPGKASGPSGWSILVGRDPSSPRESRDLGATNLVDRLRTLFCELTVRSILYTNIDNVNSKIHHGMY